MNAFVRDGALSRKRRFRQSPLNATTTNTDNVEPTKKKICRADGVKTKTTAPRRSDLTAAAGNLRPNTGESTVLATVADNEKESRYGNAEYVRAKNFLYFDFKKCNGVTQIFKDYLETFDNIQSQKKALEKIFKQCYDHTKGSVQTSKIMMKTLETGVYINMPKLPSDESTKVRNNRLSVMPCKNVEKTVKIVKNIMDLKSIPKRLEQRIQNTIEKLFGKDYLQEDLLDLNSTVPKTDCNYSNSLSTHSKNDETDKSFCQITKCYSVHNTQTDTFGVILCSNNSKTTQIVKLGHDISNKEIMVPELKSNSSNSSAPIKVINIENTDSRSQNKEVVLEILPLNIEKDVNKSMVLELKSDRSSNCSIPMKELHIENAESKSPIAESVLETSTLKVNKDVKETMVPEVKSDRSSNCSAPIKDIHIENTDTRSPNTEGVLETPPLNMEKDVKKTMVPELKNDMGFNSAALINNSHIGSIDSRSPYTEGTLIMNKEVKEETIVPELKSDRSSNISALIIDNINENSDSRSPNIIGAMETDNDEQTVMIDLEKYSIIPDLGIRLDENLHNLDIDESKERSEIWDYEHLELRIRKFINTVVDDVTKSSDLSDLAEFFLFEDFISRVDELWKTVKSDLVGELIVKLLSRFNTIKYNMLTFTCCLICTFRVIAEKSLIPPCKMKIKLLNYLDVVKKYIKHLDFDLWKKWFLPNMFYDWCFVVATMLIKTENAIAQEIKKKLVIRSATNYLKLIKKGPYIFINQDKKPLNKVHTMKGVFEFSDNNDYDQLQIGNVHTTINNTQVISNISINMPSNEPTPNTLELDDNCMNTINHTTPGYVEEVNPVLEEVCPVPEEVFPMLSICPEYSFSNSFKKNPLTWIVGNVSELTNFLKNKIPNPQNDDFITSDNNITVVANNIKSKEPCNKNLCIKDINKPTKGKRSVKQAKSPRAYFTIANNPKEFDIAYGSAATQNSSLNNNNLSSNHTQSSTSYPTTVPQCSSSNYNNTQIPISKTNPSIYYTNQTSNAKSSTQTSNAKSSTQTSNSMSCTQTSLQTRGFPQNLSSYYNNISANNTEISTNVQTPVAQNLNSNNYSNIQLPLSLQTNPSNAMSSHLPSSRALCPWASPNYQQSMAVNSQNLAAANKWPSNVTNTNRCSSLLENHLQQNNNHALTYLPPHLPPSYNINAPLITSHPNISHALTQPPINHTNLPSSTSVNVASINASCTTPQLNATYSHGFRNVHPTWNNFQPPDHNTQVSPDLPDVRIPNMPNQQNNMCMAANCTNTSKIVCGCNTTFYCSVLCQGYDWLYHKNQCRSNNNNT